MLSKPIRLKNSFQNYDWGTYDEIPKILGINKPNTQLPLAELWVGAHPKSSSVAVDFEQSLAQLISTYPKQILGDNADKMGRKLPYLFKILSARKALSIQVHPNKQQAVEGYHKERDKGIDENNPNCNYKDDNHKPELIYALTPFFAMAGFKKHNDLAKALRLLKHSEFDYWAQKFEVTGKDTLQEFYSWLLYLDSTVLNELVIHAISIAQSSENSLLKWVEQLYQTFGVDSGVFFPLLLNVIELKPGEALFLGAGCPHAYLGGTGIEIMANSDNVLRGGLTQKYMDQKELIKVTQFSELANNIKPQRGEQIERVRQFDIPCPDFQFELIELSIGDAYFTSKSKAAELYFVIQGECDVAGETYYQGQSFLIPAVLSAQAITGCGQIARVYTGI